MKKLDLLEPKAHAEPTKQPLMTWNFNRKGEFTGLKWSPEKLQRSTDSRAKVGS